MLAPFCTDSSACSAPPNMPGATCVAAVGEGEACTVDSTTMRSNCLLPLICVGGKCENVPQCP
jgi:hypothetical protein